MYLQKQRGLSPLGVLLVCCVFAFVMLVTLKLVPHYIDYNSIRTVFKDVSSLPDVKDMSAGQIRTLVNKRLLINSIRTFNFNESAYVDKNDGDMLVGFDYQVKEHMFGNIDVLLTFTFEKEIK